MNNSQAERWVDRRSKQQGPAGAKGAMGKKGDAQRTAAVAKLEAIRNNANHADIAHERQVADTIRQIGIFLRAAKQNDMARAQSEDTYGLNPSSLQEFDRQESARYQPADSYGLNRRSLGEFDRQAAARDMGPDSYGLDQRYVDAYNQSPDGYGLSPRSLMEWRRQEAARRQRPDSFGLHDAYPPMFYSPRGSFF